MNLTLLEEEYDFLHLKNLTEEQFIEEIVVNQHFQSSFIADSINYRNIDSDTIESQINVSLLNQNDEITQNFLVNILFNINYKYHFDEAIAFDLRFFGSPKIKFINNTTYVNWLDIQPKIILNRTEVDFYVYNKIDNEYKKMFIKSYIGNIVLKALELI